MGLGGRVWTFHAMKRFIRNWVLILLQMVHYGTKLDYYTRQGTDQFFRLRNFIMFDCCCTLFHAFLNQGCLRPVRRQIGFLRAESA